MDLDTLKTLEEDFYRSAFGEIIKYGLIGDEDLLVDLYEHASSYLKREKDISPMIEKCVRMKGNIVKEDEEDHGQRMVLNLGHTFGHAIESATEFQVFPHGQAVGMGIWMATKLAYRLGKIDVDYCRLVEGVLSKYAFTETKVQFNPDQLVELMGLDKKNTQGSIRLILPTGRGQVGQFREIPPERIKEVIMEVNNEARNT